MVDMKDWLQNRAEEIALDKTEHEFYDLGPHMQLMCYLKAELDWTDYYANLIDSTYDRLKEGELMG